MKFSPAVAVLIGCVAAVAGLTGCHDKPSEATVVVPNRTL
jgi:hypothetical protein